MVFERWVRQLIMINFKQLFLFIVLLLHILILLLWTRRIWNCFFPLCIVGRNCSKAIRCVIHYQINAIVLFAALIMIIK